MKIPVSLLMVALALGVVSCGGTNPPPQTSDNSTMHADDAPQVIGRLSPAGVVARQGQVDGEAPPVDAQFTIFCDAIRGPNHVLAATAIKERLAAQSGLHAWHMLHSSDQSSIFYGYYRTFDDRKNDPGEVARAQADMKRIESLKNAQGDRLFTRTLFLPLNNPDPDAPPQWNLVNTPPAAFWSLQIAAYQGSPERKKDAVDMVREFRDRGIEAYYFHGETISSVCVGAWPQEAVKRQDTQSARTSDPTQTILVVNDQLPPNISPEMVDRDGHHVTVEAPKLEIQDGTMAKAIREYPYHAVNGFDHERTAKNGAKLRDPSFLVLIPHNDGPPAPILPLPAPKLSAAGSADQAARDIVDDSKSADPGPGHLKSVDQP